VKNKIIKLNYPASFWGAMWRDALPSGNGETGASVYGGIHEETILITHTDLWWKGKTPELPDISSKLSEVRELLLENKNFLADKLYSDELKNRKYSPVLSTPLPLGDIKVIMPLKHAFKNYSRDLNMDTGEVNVSWTDGHANYKRSLFVSRSENIIVYKISSDVKSGINASLYIDRHDVIDVRSNSGILANYLPQKLEKSGNGSLLFYAAQNDDGKDFGAVAKLHLNGGKTSFDNEKIQIENADEVLILIKLFIKGDRNVNWKQCVQELEKIVPSYDILLENHKLLHSCILNSASLNLFTRTNESSNEELLMEAYKGRTTDELIEKMWNYGRYLLVSSSKEGGNPCHLYGLWCGEYEGLWAMNMLNENVQMIYWQALSGNMPELLLAVFDYYESQIEDYRTNAKNLYGCRGIFIPAPTVPDSGLIKHLSSHIIYWTGGAGWLSQHYFDYYLYTQDLNFLKLRAMPFMNEAALFYEDFLVVGNDGFYISFPSNSPENTPGNFWDGVGMGANMQTAINATMDFAIVKELLNNLISGAQISGVLIENIPKWDEMLQKIPPYQINKDGAVREWMHTDYLDNYHHRHESHLYPVFPGNEITRYNNPELFEAFSEAVKRRLVIGLKEQTGWSLAHMANCYARMGKGEPSLECLEILSRTCLLNNLYTLHNDWRNMGIGVDMPWAPVQLDANMGFCSAINEMLLFSSDEDIFILPALPSKWKKGEVKNLLAKRSIEVSIKWDYDEKTMKIALLSKHKDNIVNLILPEKEYIYENKKLMENKINMLKVKKLVPYHVELKF